MRRAKIVCTIGPATRGRAMLDRLVAAGMDVARLNFSHGTQAEHGEVIRLIREGEAEWGRPITILQDLQGLKIRLGAFEGGEATLVSGETFVLTAEPVQGTARRASISHPEYLAALRPGDQVWMDDGMIQLTVERVDGTEVHCRIIAGGVMSDAKGVSLPRLPMPASYLTDKDKDDLRFGIRHGVDFVAVSFVRSASDIQEVRKFLVRGGRQRARRGQARARGDRRQPERDPHARGRGDGGARRPRRGGAHRGGAGDPEGRHPPGATRQGAGDRGDAHAGVDGAARAAERAPR